MTTLLEIRTKVRRRLDEAAARFWEDDDLDDWINEGTRDLARRAEVLQTTSTINSVVDQQQYALPTNVLRVHRVEWSRTGTFDSTSQITALEFRPFNSMDSVWWSAQTSTTGDPYWYTMWGYPPALNLILYPVPDVSVSSGIKVYYYRSPTAATADGDTVDVLGGWDDLIVDYCEFSALRKDADPRWQEAKALFEEKTQHLIETSRHWTDQAGTFTGAGGGMVPQWIWDDSYGYGW